MNLLLSLIFLFQSVRMTEDFLPLEAGNRWVYDVSGESGQSLGQMDFSVGERTIVSGRSLYNVTGFPFAGESAGPIGLIGYDRETRQFVRISGNQEVPLFPGDAASTEVLLSDSSGIPQKFALHTGSTTLTFQRGVGIIEAKFQTADGVHVAKIRTSSIGKSNASPPSASTPRPSVPVTPEPAVPAVPNVSPVTEENPVLVLNSTAVAEGLKFELLVINKTDKLLPFKFNSSKMYDFVVTNEATGNEVWRWSSGTMFAQVIRSDSIRGNSKWTFSEVWNRRDNERNPVPPGRYSLVGVVASQPPIQSKPVMIDVQ
jgi:hypothetical protein